MISEPQTACRGCGENVSSATAVQALNSDWHLQCFRCSTCDKRLDNWYIQHNGRLYCRRDYWTKFKDACNGCSNVISGPVMVAGEHRFHPECFQCCVCQAYIGDGDAYALVERSFLYCGECYNKTVGKLPFRQHHQQQQQQQPVKASSSLSPSSVEKTTSHETYSLSPSPLTPTISLTCPVYEAHVGPITTIPSSSSSLSSSRTTTAIQTSISPSVNVTASTTTTIYAAIATKTATSSSTSSSCRLSAQQELQTPRRKPHSIQMVSIRPVQSHGIRKPEDTITSATIPTANSTTTTITTTTVTDTSTIVRGPSSPTDIALPRLTSSKDNITKVQETTEQQQQQLQRNRQQRRNQHRQHQQQQQQQQEEFQQQLRNATASSALASTVVPTTGVMATSLNQRHSTHKTYSHPDLLHTHDPDIAINLGEGQDQPLPQGQGHGLSQLDNNLNLDTSNGSDASNNSSSSNMKRLHLTLRSLSSNGESNRLSGSWDMRRSLNRNSGGPSTPCVVIDQLWPGPEAEGLEVGDRILEVNGASVRDKTLEEVSNLLTDSSAPVTVMLERDLSPLRLPKEDRAELGSPGSPDSASPVRTSLLRGGATQERAESSQAETMIVQDTLVRLRPKNSLRAKGHSPSRRRSKSPSPCPSTRQKSIDLSRSHSFTTHSQQHRVFRATDLMLGEVLGQGFFGQAIKAVHKVTGEIMVLKELHNFDESAQKSFLKEVSMLRNVSHPCVLRFMGVLYRDKKLNLVTEFIDGGALTNLLLNHSKDLSWKQRIAFAKDIANGMNYLHSIDIIHRDLNSQNCLVRSDQTVVVADFGLAKICPRHERLEWMTSSGRKGADTGEETLTTIGEGVTSGGGGGRTPRGKKKRFSRRKRQTVVGNPYWMAPEMMTKGVYDEKVDVFSFGIIVCETIARVTADPDYLPRSLDFGLNVEAFHKRFCEDVPEPYFMLAVLCSQMEPDQRPSFDKIYMLCEALSLHVEHKMAVPVELQGSTVQFYRRYKEETYGTNFKDIDSVTEADVSTDQEKDSSVTEKDSCRDISVNETSDDMDNKKQYVTKGSCGLLQKKGERCWGLSAGSGDQGYPSSNQASDCDTEVNDANTGHRGNQPTHITINARTDIKVHEDISKVQSSISHSNTEDTAFETPKTPTTAAETKQPSITEASSLTPRPTCLAVTTRECNLDDQAYFSCPSSSPPASPSSTSCQFSSCHGSPDPNVLTDCLSQAVDLTPSSKGTNSTGDKQGQIQSSSTPSTVSVRPKSISPATDSISSGTQAQLHKLTSISLSDITPLSGALTVDSTRDHDRTLHNGSAESGICADTAVSPKQTNNSTSITLSPQTVTHTSEQRTLKSEDAPVKNQTVEEQITDGSVA